ncbi:MAG: hypothetical protein F6K58_28395 [Symploca sp. SIO2E9]|nr:hypothetical protein [Symploca sp. SIO2E9]
MIPISGMLTKPALSLPEPEDLPEEVLRTEIITQARSPIDGKPLTAAEYAQLKAQLAQRSTTPDLSPDIKEVIFLLRLRQMLQTLTPF